MISTKISLPMRWHVIQILRKSDSLIITLRSSRKTRKKSSRTSGIGLGDKSSNDIIGSRMNFLLKLSATSFRSLTCNKTNCNYLTIAKSHYFTHVRAEFQLIYLNLNSVDDTRNPWHWHFQDFIVEVGISPTPRADSRLSSYDGVWNEHRDTPDRPHRRSKSRFSLSGDMFGYSLFMDFPYLYHVEN